LKKGGRKRIERKWPFFFEEEEDRTRGRARDRRTREFRISQGKRVVFHSKSDQEEGRKSISPTPTSLTLFSFGWDNFD
jgi:hypothetical protein